MRLSRLLGIAISLSFGAFAPLAFAEPAPAQSPTIVRATPTTATKMEPAMLQKETQLASRFTAAQRAKIGSASKELITRIDAKPAKGTIAKTPETHAREIAIATWGASGGDIDALAYLVLMQAAKSSQEDLKSIMAKVKAINAVKSCQRSQTCIDNLQPTAELDAATLNAVKAQLDSLSEMGEMESLRLQMAMDRMSKMMSTLSNILKKLSDTASGVTQNLK